MTHPLTDPNPPFVKFTHDVNGVPITLHINEEEWPIAEVVILLRSWPDYEKNYQQAIELVTKAAEWEGEAKVWEAAARRAQQQGQRLFMEKHLLENQHAGDQIALELSTQHTDWYQSVIATIIGMGDQLSSDYTPQNMLEQIIAFARRGLQGPPDVEQPPVAQEVTYAGYDKRNGGH